MVINQSSAFPVTPNYSSSLLKRIVWSMVSKAAERSSNVIAVILLASIDTRMPLWISVGQFRLSETSYMQTDTDWMCLNCLYVNLVGSPLLSQEPWKGS